MLRPLLCLLSVFKCISSEEDLRFFSAVRPENKASFLGMSFHGPREENKNKTNNGTGDLLTTSGGFRDLSDLEDVLGTDVKNLEMSADLAERLQTGPTVLLEGSTIHYIPMVQMVTALPTLFPVPGYYHPDPVAAPFSVEQRYLPYPLQQTPGLLLHHPVYLTQKAEQPARQEVHPPLVQRHIYKNQMKEGVRRAMYINPSVMEMMKAMDHSLLSFPSRFEYKSAKPVMPLPNLNNLLAFIETNGAALLQSMPEEKRDQFWEAYRRLASQGGR